MKTCQQPPKIEGCAANAVDVPVGGAAGRGVAKEDRLCDLMQQAVSGVLNLNSAAVPVSEVGEDRTDPNSHGRILDRGALLKRVCGDEELAGEMLGCFLKDMPRQFRRLRALIAIKQAPEIAAVAHLIKGGASAIACLPMSDLACSMEEQANSSELLTLAEQLMEMERLFLELEAAVVSDAEDGGARVRN